MLITNPKLNGLKFHKFERKSEKKTVNPIIKKISPAKVFSFSLEVAESKDIGVKVIIFIFLILPNRKAYHPAPRRR